MGITGLLPFVKNSCRPINIRDFKGCAVAVDAYSWLHKGAFSCAERLVKGEKTNGYVHYCIKQVNLLLDAGVKPIMVFDGCNLESKAGTEKKRRENREKTRQRGKEFLCQGKIKEARECFQRCVDVTPEMAFEVIQACKAKHVDCIVAPYEADAQMAYLNLIGMAQIVITEDSDLIVFGCKKILFKMDSCGGGLLYEKECLPKCFGSNAERMSFDKFRYMCILSGCDYLPSLPGIGLAKAYKFLTLTSNPDIASVLPKLASYLKMPKLVVDLEYREAFVKANNTFLYQLVFCPKKKTLVPLNPYPEGMDISDMQYAGKYVTDDLAVQIAAGNINVKTMGEFPNSSADYSLSARHKKNIVWDESNIVEHTLPKAKVETSFKFSQKTSRSPKPAAMNKRMQNDLQSDDNGDVQDTLLFSEYRLHSGNSPMKRQKKNEGCVAYKDDLNKLSQDKDGNESIVPKAAVFSPFRKTLSPTSVNVSKTSANFPFRKIVKSRFFADAADNCTDHKTQNKSSWWDKIEDEYVSKPADEIPEMVETVKSSDFSQTPSNIKKRNSLPLTSIIKDKENVDMTVENNLTNTQFEANNCISRNDKSFENCQSDEDKQDTYKCFLSTQSINESHMSIESESSQVDCSNVSDASDEISVICEEKSSLQSCDTSPLPTSLHSSPSVESLKSHVKLPFCPFRVPDKRDVTSISPKHKSPYFDASPSPKLQKDGEKSLIENSEKKSGKILTRCRTPGLSKKRRSKEEKQLPVKDTLFNFNFTRLSTVKSPFV